MLILHIFVRARECIFFFFHSTYNLSLNISKRKKYRTWLGIFFINFISVISISMLTVAVFKGKTIFIFQKKKKTKKHNLESTSQISLLSLHNIIILARATKHSNCQWIWIKFSNHRLGSTWMTSFFIQPSFS